MRIIYMVYIWLLLCDATFVTLGGGKNQNIPFKSNQTLSSTTLSVHKSDVKKMGELSHGDLIPFRAFPLQ
jgi:hypothetical protein